MELYVSSQPKCSSPYNEEYRDTNIYVPTFAWLFRQLSHSVGVGTSRILEDRIMGIYDENRIKTVYYDQCRYDSSNLCDNKDEGVMSLVETLDDDDEASCSRFSS
jgi:hypothetical protein